MDSRRRLGAILLLLVGALFAALLLMQHHGEPGAVGAVNELCGNGQTSGCEVVAQSEYSSFAGIPLAALGLLFYLSLLALLLLAPSAGAAAEAAAGRLALGATLLALALDLVLLGLQGFVIKAFCRLCLATYAVNAVVAVALWPARRLKGGPAALGRLAFTAWAIAAAGIASGVFAWNGALVARAANRAGTLLGSPATAAAVTTGGDEALRAEVQRLRESLDDPQKYQEYLTAKSEREFGAATVQSFELAGVPVKGPADARIQVVEFSDFLCPFCRAIAGAFKDFLPQSQGRVSVRFKNYPLDQECNVHMKNTVHVGACWLARGGICAQQQGRFWAYHDRIFDKPLREAAKADVVKLASEAGLDAASLGACLDAPGTDARLKAEIEEAERAGVKATPTLFLNGKKLPRVNDFLVMVEKESTRLGLPPLAKPGAAK
jgi:protein-disulfide isomerase/uncharacterized membrane protein